MPPRFLVHDGDNCYGPTFDRRLRNLGITQVRTPFRSPRVNAIAKRWVKLVRGGFLHPLTKGERSCRRALRRADSFSRKQDPNLA